MSHPCAPTRAGLFLGVLATPGADVQQAFSRLERAFGKIVFSSTAFAFDSTEYYKSEMGEGILRSFHLFEALVRPDDLTAIKTETNRIETVFAEGENRRINLDPGLLSANQLVLATGKPAPHRIYIGKGLYGDLSLKYEFGGYIPLKWTYPDYYDRRTLDFLDEARKYVLDALKLNERELKH